jgi:ribosomal protein L37AE/L43A
MAEFLEQYGSDDKCEAALITSRWPQGFACPVCGGPASCPFRREGRLYWQCASCRHQCSVISGTVFESTKLPLTSWFLAMHLLTQAKNNVSALELGRHLGVSYKTAWLLKHNVMEVMRVREDARQLTGRVEMDDAYLGGERSGGKAGRGSENKVPFIAAVQTTEDGQPVLACFAQCPFTTEAVQEFAAKSLVLPLTVVSDGLGCFTAIGASAPFTTAPSPVVARPAPSSLSSERSTPC